MNSFILDLLAFSTLLSAILVITSNNPVISVLFLISAFVNAAGYLLIIGVGFIGISYLIVYVGAIAILFLFVVIILNIQLTEIVSLGSEYNKNLPLRFLIGSLFLIEILSMLPNNYKNLIIIPKVLFNNLNSKLLQIENLSTNSFINIAFNNPRADSNFNNLLQVQSLGQGFYTYGALWLLIVSIILLLAIIGPIVLCLRQK